MGWSARLGLTSVFKMAAGKQLAFPATSLLGGVVLQRKLLHGALLAVRAQEPALQACGSFITKLASADSEAF